MELDLIITDGGRGKYFNQTNVRDCVTRAIAIATRQDYKKVYDEIFEFTGRSPRNGVSSYKVKKYMEKKGYKWYPKMKIGSGVTCHLSKGEVPMDKRIICNCSKHLVAVINGVIYDNHDCRRGGNRAVYGYWVVE